MRNGPESLTGAGTAAAGPIRVAISAADRIIGAGLAKYLTPHTSIEVQDGPDGATGVLILAIDSITSSRPKVYRDDSLGAAVPIVLVVDEVSEDELLVAIDIGVMAVLTRATITAERLQQTIVVTAAGGGDLPHDLLGGLLRHFDRLQREVLIPNRLSRLGLTAREIEVLRQIADGMDTAEIAESMAYSERTIKGIISTTVKRLNLRNRTHAVAYACRTGII